MKVLRTIRENGDVGYQVKCPVTGHLIGTLSVPYPQGRDEFRFLNSSRKNSSWKEPKNKALLNTIIEYWHEELPVFIDAKNTGR